jgi:hypothetical protein
VNQKDSEDYFQWLKDKGKMKYELTDIFINKDGVLYKEERMAWCGKTSPEDYKEFCLETGREYEGEYKLLVFESK